MDCITDIILEEDVQIDFHVCRSGGESLLHQRCIQLHHNTTVVCINLLPTLGCSSPSLHFTCII
jgi:hypothetical protein